MYRNCQKCSGLMYGPNYPAWQNNCNRCEMETVKDNAHAEEMAKAKSQPVSSGPIVDSQSVAEIENEEIRAELAELRAKLAAAEEEKSSLRANVICAMNDIQHGLPATGHAKLTLLLDGIMRSPGNLAERLQAQLAAATEREWREALDKANTDRDVLASQNAELRAALREAADVIEAKASGEQMTGAFAAKYLRDRADAIAAERDHIADAGKKVEGGAA